MNDRDPEVPETADHKIPSSTRIMGFTGWNLFGFCAPMLVAFFSIPLFIDGLGTERFGALTLVWMLVGYFSILDLGMGRAMTKLTAEYLGLGKKQDLPGIFWTALILMTALGLAGAFVLFFGSGWLSESGLNFPIELRREVMRAFQVVSLGMPFTVAVTGLIGVLETHQRFRLINLIRVPLGIGTFAAPLAVLPFTNSLVWVVTVLIGVRILEFAIFFVCCLRCIPEIRHEVRFVSAMVRPLVTFGGWMTVSNIALPLMIHIDRFIIGAVRTISEVAYYANPAEVVVKMLILPRAWVSALFPPMTMHLARGSKDADVLFGRAVKMLLLILFVASVALCALAPEFLRVWIGEEFAREGGLVMQILVAGIFVYALSYLAFSLLQSAGRPDLSARWHLIELPFFLAVAWWATRYWGIAGMAVVWALRGLSDAAVLFPLALKFVPGAKHEIVKCGVMSLAAIGVMTGLAATDSFAARVVTATAVSVLFVAGSWFWLMSARERDWAAGILTRFMPGGRR